MKTKNTLENKAAFFAQYWGQDICNDIGCALSNETFEEVNASTSIEYAFLKLIPLSQISDEDAINIVDSGHAIEFLENGWRVKNTKFVFDYKINTVDLLRSKGYAVPWRDLSVDDLVAYEWVKLKSE